MTKYFEDLLKNLRDTSTPTTNQHHLFLLGTGVNYINRPTKKEENFSYVRGETFSYAAQLVTHVLGEEDAVVKHADALFDTENFAHAYHSPSVDVINGADLLGFGVGDRIAKGLMLTLGAVAQGKKELHVSGFSRGGVESIVLMHELERVRAALDKDLALEDHVACRSLATIVAESDSVPGVLYLPGLGHPSWTRQALNNLIVGKTATGDDRDLKKKLLDNLNAMQVKLFVLDPVPGGNVITVGRIGWQEECFYEALPSFVVKKQEFVQKHETSNCFKPIVPLDMPYEVIPGCHGTGDGNQFDHNGKDVLENKDKDEYPNRDLSGVQNLVLRRWFDLTFPEPIAEFKIDLGHQELDAVTNAYLPQAERGRCEQLLANYDAIQKNYPAFEWLATRNYKGLGQYMAERQVHYHMRGNTPVTGLDAYGDGEKFMNLQHVQLWMSEALKSFNFFEKTLVEQIQWLTVNLNNAFTTHSGTEAQTEEWMVTGLLRNQANHPMIQESLSFLINTVTQTFMRNHLTLEQKQACQKCVESAFDVLRSCSAEESKHPYKALAEQVEQAIRRDLTTTMIRHQNSLMSVSQQLLRDQESIINDFDLPENDRKSIDSPLTWMIGAQKVYQELGFLAEQTAALEPWCSDELLIESWGKMIPNFSDKIEGTPGIDPCKANLKSYISQQRKLILASAIELLSKMPDALQNQPKELDNDFYKLIHRQANISNVEANVKKLEEGAKAGKEAMDQLVQQNAEEKDILLKKCETAEARIKAMNTPEQENALLKVVALKRRCREYLNHLTVTDDGSQLQKDKVAAVNDMLVSLKDSKLLPADRLSDFHLKVENENTQDRLKEHRDPEWQRFFRDCLRILARVFSGVGFYRMANGESPQFFKPSHGEQFVEDTLLKSAPTA